MLSEEEKIEQAVINILRGTDIESAALIVEKAIIDNYIITKGRVNILKIATRQILNFIDEYQNKWYLDVVREKVKANENLTKLQDENTKKDNIIKLMAKYIAKEDKTEKFCNYKTVCDQNCEECVVQYFKDKVTEK